MAAALTKPTPPRLSLAFAAALGLHLLIALGLPGLQRLFGAGAALKPSGSALRALPPPQPTAPTGDVIPIRLPLAGFQMQTELGAIARSSPQKGAELPGAGKAPAGKFAMSPRLGTAASEALAADQRARPTPPPTDTTRLVAELRLASGSGRGGGNAGGTAVGGAKPASAPARIDGKPAAAAKPVEALRRELAPVEKVVPTAPPAAAAPQKPAPPPIQQPIRPQIGAPVQRYRGAAADSIAVAPPLPPRTADDGEPSSPPLTAGNAASLGAPAAPDRGPGEAVSGRMEFFQKLTTQLFQVNQQVLAEAIRATPRLTVEVRFTIDRSGRVLAAQAMRSTGDAALDAKAVNVILRASPVPQMAADMPSARIELSFPVQIYR